LRNQQKRDFSGDVMAAMILINSFEVPPGREDEFFSLWEQVNAYMRTKRGYLGHKLHRALAPDAPFRFVNVAQWASVEHFQAAHDARFHELVGQPAWSTFQAHPALYEAIHEGQSDTGSIAHNVMAHGSSTGR
jgi:heme-degrading monooxygenase HmoA